MPISRKDFEAGNFRKRRNSREDHPVAVLLSKAKDSEYGYTVKEIARAVRMKPESVRSMLAELKKDGVIVHRAPYFAWKRSKK
jgi:Mn-dependent DtxR family transcriptional regulator